MTGRLSAVISLHLANWSYSPTRIHPKNGRRIPVLVAPLRRRDTPEATGVILTPWSRRPATSASLNNKALQAQILMRNAAINP